MNIALLTCEKFPNLFEPDQQLIPELAKHGITAQPAVWDDASTDWTKFDWLIFRNTWDYYEKELQFNHWLDQIEELQIKTLNPTTVIRQNKHKFYLRDLEQKGVRILPTVFINKTDSLNLAKLIPKEWNKAVIKPAFSAGSYLTQVFSLEEIAVVNENYSEIAKEKELLLQEFRPEIQTLGETSLIFFDKKYAHAINKKPAAGDFRIQVQFGGIYEAIQPNSALIEQAQKIVDTFPDPLLYARVDGIVIDNQLHLMEIECIEPDLYFNFSEGARERFVNAIVASISR